MVSKLALSSTGITLSRVRVQLTIAAMAGRGPESLRSACTDQSKTRRYRLSGPPSGQSAGSGARTHDRRVPADVQICGLASHCATDAPRKVGRDYGLLAFALACACERKLKFITKE
ncbi:hypothetical protein PoB_001016000 [Plakobranchus ocellatus]|uniref:Uncharacterized protein n=1 Tax=Plakobranchus ocellatus TaxID=259542 RepID=A0AAV3YLP8_9GAST|nr:hypothetical protein PoB_001016000 [Plakobranchus ocellatus]